MATNCSNCGATTEVSAKFCAQCGSSLTASLNEQIERTVKKLTKDQKLLEAEAAESVVNKLRDWAKTFGVLIGVPLGLLAMGLGALGIKTYADFVRQVNSARAELSSHVDAAKNDAIATMKKDTDAAKNDAIATMKKDTKDKIDAVASEGEALREQIRKIREEVAINRSQMRTLDVKVEEIREIVEFKGDVSEPTKAKLQKALTDFQKYFQPLGFDDAERISVDITPTPHLGMISSYDPLSRTLFITKSYADEIDLALREYSHHALSSGELLNHPEWKRNRNLFAIESGLANYFVCSSKNSPAFAEAYSVRQRQSADWLNLNNQRKFSEITAEPNSVYYDGATVWGGVFWDIRKIVGHKLADDLIYKTWNSLKKENFQMMDGKGFAELLLKTHESLSGSEHSEAIKKAFRQRGMEL